MDKKKSDVLDSEESSMCSVRGQVGIGVHSVADALERMSVYIYAICTVCTFSTSYVFPVGMWSLPRKYNTNLLLSKIY